MPKGITPDSACAMQPDVALRSGEVSHEHEDAANQPVDLFDLVDRSTIVEVEKIDAASLPKKHFYHFVKRLFDIVACGIAIIILAIPMCIIAILIKKDSPGPVFYKQERLGKDGVPFDLIKFRSMYVDAEKQGAQWAKAGDSRITPIGKKLRAHRLAELPQFFQVISGKLTLVGPRPERPVFYDEFEKYIHGFNQRTIVKPGLSGLAQVSGGYNLKPAEKIVYDIEYIKTCSIGLDLKIVLKTLKIVFNNDGAR